MHMFCVEFSKRYSYWPNRGLIVPTNLDKNWFCHPCKEKCPDTILDQRHLLECKYLIGKNEIISYIPTYEDLFRGDIEDQIYISRILKENLSILKAQTTM